jgi:filamentous hemagglutinin family protein
MVRVVRRNRQALMVSTALQAAMIVLSLPANAQPASNARPVGGTVVGGSAAISQTTSNTRINQSSQRAAINWQSFDVGSQQSVTFSQPNTSAVALNRVTGPDPSQIAGRIDANGQVILINQSGVNFYKGAQVNTAGLIATTANMTDKSLKTFMAGGKVTLDVPGDPNGKIDNQGTITIKQAGLAAFVAPQVANSGTISAKLGHVVLAGAQTATLDLYGDGMLSLDVTNQVTQVPVDKSGNKVTALVTNTGVIIADGGTVQLTAAAADGIVQNLVQAGGKIRAETVGDHTGTIALNGVGGSILVEGQLSAPGRAPGAGGGAIEVVSTGNVTIASSARINASGKAGGGTVAIGTTLARAKGGPSVSPAMTAKNVTVQQGATITASATDNGNGGTVTALSTNNTAMAGVIDVRGGEQGGDGGLAEVSGGMISLTGHVDASAPVGKMGTLLLDPLDLTVSNTQPPDATFEITNTVNVSADGSPNATTNSWITPATLEGQTANVSLAATQDLLVSDPVLLTGAGQGLSLQAGRNITINASVTVPGTLYLKATAQNKADPGVLEITDKAPLSGGIVYLSSNSAVTSSGPGTTSAIDINAPVTSTGPSPLITVACDCNFSPGPSPGLLSAVGGTIEYGPATNGFPQVMLTHDESNLDASLLRFGLSHDPILGTQALAGSLQVGGTTTPTGPISLDGHNLELNASGAITQLSGVTLTNVATLTGNAGSAVLNGGNNGIANLGPFTTSAGDFSLQAAGPLNVAGGLSVAGALTFNVQGDLNVTAANAILQAGSDLTLGTGGNVTSVGNLQLLAGRNITINASVTVPRTLYLKATAQNKADPGILDIEAPLSGGTVYLSSNSAVTASGQPDSKSAINIAAPVTSTGPSPLITVACDCNISSPSGPGALPVILSAVGGTIEYGPATNGYAQVMTTHDENVFNASLLRFGLSHDPILGTQALAGSLQVGGTTTPGADATGPISLDGHNLELNASGAVAQLSGVTLTNVATLTGNAGSAVLNGGNNGIANLGPFTTSAGDFTLQAAGPLNVTGPLSASGNITLSVAAGTLTTNTTIDANGNVNLSSGGSISQIGGDIFSGVSGNNSVTLSSAGDISLADGFIFAENVTLSAGGNLNQSGNSLVVGTALFNGTISLPIGGDFQQLQNAILAAGGGHTAVSVKAGGSIVQNNASLIGGDNVSINAGVDLTQNDTSSLLSLIGPLTVSAGRNISLAGEGISASDAVLNAGNDVNIANIAGQFLGLFGNQLGNLQVTVADAFKAANLDAPFTNFTLNLNAGSATGQLNVNTLTINGSGGTVTFENSLVGGLTGSDAAKAAQSNPSNNPDYLLNGCEIGVGCTVVSSPGSPGSPKSNTVGVNQQFVIITRQGVSVSSGIGNIVSSLIEDATTAAFQSAQQSAQKGVPVLNPLGNLASGPLRDRQDDPDLLLPNVSEKDY